MRYFHTPSITQVVYYDDSHAPAYSCLCPLVTEVVDFVKEIRNCFVRRHRIGIQTHMFLPAFPSCNLTISALLSRSACSTSVSSRRIWFKTSVSYVDSFLFWLNSDNNNMKSYMLISMSARVSSIALLIYRMSQEECDRLRQGVPYVKVYRYNLKHLCPKLNGYGDNGQRKVWSSGGSTHCTCHCTSLIEAPSLCMVSSYRNPAHDSLNCI